MARRGAPRSTECELEILQILWRDGAATVRQVYIELHFARGCGYASILKLMQIMVDKGLLSRDTSVRPQVYRPLVKKSLVEWSFIRDLLAHVLNGSANAMVCRLLEEARPSREELLKIQQVLENHLRRLDRPSQGALERAIAGSGKKRVNIDWTCAS